MKYKNKMLIRNIIILLFCAFPYVNVIAAGSGGTEIKTLKEERNLINEGNELYNKQRFADAEVLYRKALEANHNSEYAQYNLATALLRQSGTKDLNNGNNPLSEAQQILSDLIANANNNTIIEKASYNLGNIAFNNNNYQQSIEYYKNALRKNPSNDLARQNLRLAQKKLQEQQDQQDQQNKDKNQDKNQENKDQQQQEKDKQNDQQQNKDQQQQDQKKEEQKEQPQQQQSGISDSNAEKILKAMENEEAATRRRVEAQRKKAGQANRRQPLKPW